MFKKVLIAYRGEIAVRIIRACKEWGIGTVAVHSDVDSDSMHVRLADESVCIGSHQPQNSYLNIAAIMSAADVTGVDAIHPGYGFLAEAAPLAAACAEAGLVFVGPSIATLELFGDKVAARRFATSHDVPGPAGSASAVSVEEAQSFLTDLGEDAAAVIKAI